MNIGFEKVYLIQNSMNLPVSEVISTYVYNVGMISHPAYSPALSALFSEAIRTRLPEAVRERQADVFLSWKRSVPK